MANIWVSEHPFESPEARMLIKGLESDLAALYPDWDQLSHPNQKPNPRPKSPPPTDIDPSTKSTTPDQNGMSSDEDDASRSGLFFFVAFDGDAPVACAALRVLSTSSIVPTFAPSPIPEGLSSHLTYGEIKRMYVAASHRRLGISKIIISHIESFARQRLQLDCIVLEVGLRQTVAVQLYYSAGFSQIPMYGEYIGMEVAAGGDSICMEKMLYKP